MEISELQQDAPWAHDAVGTVYEENISEIVRGLTAGNSVLVVCDKRLSSYVQGNLRGRWKEEGTIAVSLLKDIREIPTVQAMRDSSETIRKALQEQPETPKLVIFPHLDFLTTVEEGRISEETRNTILQILYIVCDMNASILGFRDPSLRLPAVLERFFDLTVTIDVMDDNRFLRALSRSQASILDRDRIDESLRMQLFQAVSGLNVVEFQRLMSNLEREFEAAPDGEDQKKIQRDRIFKTIRDFTACGPMRMAVPTNVEVGGYHALRKKIEDELIELIRQRRTTSNDALIQRIDRLLPRGILFEGPPGTGKTHLARWIASEIQATLYVVNGPELKSMYFGESESKVREIFIKARKSAPSIIVFDEFDSIAGKRGQQFNSGVSDSIVNQLLTELDGFHHEELCLVVATTNFFEKIDSAFLRPGRFEYIYRVEYPESAGEIRELLAIFFKQFGMRLPAEMLDSLASDMAEKPIGEPFSCDEIKGFCRRLGREYLRQGAPGKVLEMVAKVKEEFYSDIKKVRQEG